MNKRKKLQSILQKIHGVKAVYFAVPSKGMQYPCIKFSYQGQDIEYANNKKYIKGERYIITFITDNILTAHEVLNQLDELQYCNFDRPYEKDGLHHYVYTITI